ncbi:hypothetical protein ABZS76_05895 [Streptomyces sp. NPDC005562]|uniref:hypothetical protein n=1 Tax=unclassified Streptomyces TaxID=2593676 RepID=UPI0033AED4CF
MSQVTRKAWTKLMDRVLPSTTAAAGCAPGCDKVWKSSGGQAYQVTCCYRPNCSYYCY